MALSNRDRVRKGMDELVTGLVPFVERELKAKLGGYWKEEVATRIKAIRLEDGVVHWDTQAVLKAMVDNWQGVFKDVLGFVERAYVGELLEVRNMWAHEDPFTSDDVYRALDTMQRLLQAVSAGEQVKALDELRTDLQRQVYAEQARNVTRYKQLTLEGTPQEGLQAWRALITPHPDVASGKYAQAEFAADLAQVYRGEGSDEYRDPKEFFRRTFITVGLRDLLSGALERLEGKGGDPVVELQTNFGGGKTHSMLALYHLFSGVDTASLEGLEPVVKDAGVAAAPTACRAVLVGTALSPGEVSVKPDGTEVHTLWGEMAWQLGGKKGYAMVAESDKAGTSPGSAQLAKVFKAHSPCLVLIDEWVAYARQLVGKSDLPAGTFESQSTFAQAITEAARAASKTMVVAAVPSSKIEIGGEHGEYALDALKNVIERVGKPWRPATSDEGFEIVRRRLFEPMSGRESFAARDAVIDAFSKMYRTSKGEFPSECSESSYRDEMRASYPIHPELFKRLYGEWSTLDRFQRTRGVLRLLAKVIHRLWVSQDGGLLIMPASVGMDDHAIKSELTRYLSDVWEPIISKDVDGPDSLPLAIDQENPTLGRYSACRRVARALYIGTAPGAEGDTPGVGAERIMLGCAQPGEAVPTFGDALRRVSDRATFIHQDGNRHWISTRPNLNRTAEDRAAQLLREPEELHAEIVRRLEGDRTRGEFAGVHICPKDSSDVPDDPAARLVILGPELAHRKGKEDSAARKAVIEVLNKRGSSPRINRNCLVFVTPDQKEMEGLLGVTAAHLAWSTILRDKRALNLDQFQLAQAESKVTEFDRTVDLRIGATWAHALVPVQHDPAGEIEWEETRVGGSDSIAKRTSAKLASAEALMSSFGGVRLRMELDKYLWRDRDHVTVSELCEWFPRYLYLQRLRDRDTILDAVRDGVARVTVDDTFAVAESFDPEKGHYAGLRMGGSVPTTIDNRTCLIKPAVARAQLEKEKYPPPVGGGDGVSEKDVDKKKVIEPEPVAKRPTVFFGSAVLSSGHIGRDAGRIADEVISHIESLLTADVRVTLEIHAHVPAGIDDRTVSIVTENARTLKFDDFAFEEE